ncbi:MAG: GNAT family N-acetyltransferase [Thermoleophilaceae bacterium]|nr:GNAT family N-acetyltransferase [Thermoleophilaceae bacterium]
MRPAEPGDARAIAELIARCDETPPSEGQVRRRLDDRAAWTRVAKRDEAALGVVSWRPVDGAARLSWLFVDPTERGTGLASELLDAAVGAMRAAGHSEAELWVHDGNEGARDFYARQGWQPGVERRSQERLGERLVRYRLEL